MSAYPKKAIKLNPTLDLIQKGKPVVSSVKGLITYMKRNPHRANRKPRIKWCLIDGFSLFISVTKNLFFLRKSLEIEFTADGFKCCFFHGDKDKKIKRGGEQVF
ncbi:MAG: hypothetical protein BalsKO_13600 [Balneolaceae bacterium]